MVQRPRIRSHRHGRIVHVCVTNNCICTGGLDRLRLRTDRPGVLSHARMGLALLDDSSDELEEEHEAIVFWVAHQRNFTEMLACFV